MADTDRLLEFLAPLTFDDLPDEVVVRTLDLILDWLGSTLAGRLARPTQIMDAWANHMGPKTGRAECLGNGRLTSPVFAAMVNGAASHVVEQDDVHNGSVVHPGATVIPAALAAAQDREVSGRDLILSIVAGYEMAIRVGRFLGPSHYKIFHTSGTAGTLGAAVAAGKILGLSADRLRHAVGSAGTQAAGLWEFLRDAADSKQLHIAKAASDGLLSAYGAEWGLLGARQILEGPQGLGTAFSKSTRPEALSSRLGESWAVLETSLKWHASCRHTHPSADALEQVMVEHHLSWDDIETVEAHVHQAAIDVLGPAEEARTIHQSKFSMPFVLSLIAIKGHAAISDFNEDTLHDASIRQLMKRVTMVQDDEVEQAYPERWLGRVRVTTKDGHEYRGQVDVPKGDPGNFLSRAVIKEKVLRLARYGGIEDENRVLRAMGLVEDLEGMATVPRLTPV